MRSVNGSVSDMLTQQTLMDAAIDITGAELVQVQTTADGRVWVNVNGICVLRVCRAQIVKVDSAYSEKKEAPSPAEVAEVLKDGILQVGDRLEAVIHDGVVIGIHHTPQRLPDNYDIG